MEWEFTPQQVVKAEVDYGFEDFRCDLYEEVQMNAGGDSAQVKATYELLFDLCYWLATERPFEGFLAQHAAAPPTCEFLREVAPAMAANAEMLGAILQRMIMGEVERGLPLEEGVASVHSTVARMSAGLPH
jgi:hypothetical protein